MNPADPLAALQPLREPAAIGWWPPAPGWWLLAAILLLALAAGAYAWHARRRRNAYRRQALRQLDALYADFARHGDAQRLLAGCNALLKSVALRVFPGAAVAQQHGGAWTDFLAAQSPGGAPFDAELATALYRPEPPDIDTAGLRRRIEAWIRQHRAPR